MSLIWDNAGLSFQQAKDFVLARFKNNQAGRGSLAALLAPAPPHQILRDACYPNLGDGQRFHVAEP